MTDYQAARKRVEANIEGLEGGERAGLLDAYEAFIKLDFMAAARPDLTAFCFKAGEACRIALGLPKPPPAGQAKQIAEARAALSREGEGWRERCENVEKALSNLARAARRVIDARDAFRSPERKSHPNLVLEEAEAWIALQACFDNAGKIDPAPPSQGGETPDTANKEPTP